MNYVQQLDYLKQEESRCMNRLKKVYKLYSNDDWELLGYMYYENPTGCDYPKCPRSNPNSGIKHVYRVQNKRTGNQLNLGSTCYLKLFFEKEVISNKEKLNFETNVRKSINSKDIFEKDLEERRREYISLINQINEELYILKNRLSKFDIVLDINRFKNLSSNTHSENLKTASILEKYKVELDQLEKMKRTELENQKKMKQNEIEEKKKLKAKLEIEERKNILLKKNPLLSNELIVSYLKLVNCELKTNADSNGEVYMKYSATIFSKILKKGIGDTAKDIMYMERYGLIKLDSKKQKLYLVYDFY